MFFLKILGALMISVAIILGILVSAFVAIQIFDKWNNEGENYGTGERKKDGQ